MVPVNPPVRPLLLASIATALLASPALGHGITETLPIEHQLLQDEGEDAFLVIDGYDLWDLYVRETYFPEHGHGLTFRFTLYGGFADPSIASALHIELGATGPAGDWSAVLSTTDDQTWTAEGAVLIEALPEPDISGYETQLQAFVPYDTLGASIGSVVQSAWMRSWVDDRLVDVAPGGVMLPVTETEVPTESRRTNETITLTGPIGYTQVVSGTFHDNGLWLVVANPFTTGQHFAVELHAPSGWSASASGGHIPVDGGRNTTIVVQIERAGEEPLELALVSDLGGRQPLYIEQTRDGLRLLDEPPPPPEPQSAWVRDSPAPTPLLALLIGLAVLLRRVGPRANERL